MIRYYIKEIKYCHKKEFLLMAIVKYIFSSKLLRNIVKTKLYNRLYLYKIQRSTRNINPTNFAFESGNFCNAKCLMCPFTKMKRKKEMLDFHLFRKCVDEALEYFEPKQFILSGFGEPLLVPDILDRVSYIKEKSDVPVKFFTNASLLSRSLSGQLIEAGLDEINISINSTSECAYQKITGLDYETTAMNINHLIREKKLLNSCTPLINLSFMDFGGNKDETRRASDQWIDKVDSVVVRQPENWAGAIKTENASCFETAYPCLFPFNTLDVLCNGDVVPCCRDYEGSVVFGNVRDNTLLEIWNSTDYARFRSDHLRLRFSEIEICRKCNTNIIDPFQWWQE